MTRMVIQTRDVEGETLTNYEHLEEAFAYADIHPKVWKISWDRIKRIGGREYILRFRFVRSIGGGPGPWREQPMEEIIDSIMKGPGAADGHN